MSTLPAKPWISGPGIAHLKKGWARMPFVGMRVHYWVEDSNTVPATIGRGRVRYYRAACGVLSITDERVPALHPGNWPRCKLCQKRQPK